MFFKLKKKLFFYYDVFFCFHRHMPSKPITLRMINCEMRERKKKVNLWKLFNDKEKKRRPKKKQKNQ